MTINLPDELDVLLRDVAQKAQLNISSIRKETGLWQLNPANRKMLMDAVSDEFASCGLLPNDEPNQRGLLLEDLLDQLNGIGQ
jgi:hypothetical protein